MTDTSLQRAATPGVIARRFGEPLHRVLYVIQSRKIVPCGRVGIYRVFSEADVRRIGDELRRIALRKGGAA